MYKINKDLSVSAIVSGAIAVLVSFSGPALIIFQAAKMANLTEAQLSSWLWAVSIASGLCGLILSVRYRLPVICAWSTPGAALLVSSWMNYSYAEAIGAFLVSSALVFIAGISGIFEKLMNKIPSEIVSALLAGILFNFGINVFRTAETDLTVFIIMVLSYYLMKKILPLFAVIGSLILGITYTYFNGEFGFDNIRVEWTNPVFTFPELNIQAIISLALPLFIVTMLSQNAPGVGVLRASGYHNLPISSIISFTGIISGIFSFFGSHAINLAAITAAICTNEEAHPDPEKRYIAGVFCGVFYIFVGLFGSTIAIVFFTLPHSVISIIAGLALLGAISSGISQSFSHGKDHEAAIATLLVTASNMSLFGVGSAFWGIVTGLTVLYINSLNKQSLLKYFNCRKRI